MDSVWVTVKHPHGLRKVLSVRVEPAEDGNYTVKGAAVKSQSKGGAKWVSEEFGPDDFSRKIAEHGFEENEVRFSIEESIEANQKESAF